MDSKSFFVIDYYKILGYCYRDDLETFNSIEEALNDCSQRKECRVAGIEFDYGQLKAKACERFEEQWTNDGFLLMKRKRRLFSFQTYNKTQGLSSKLHISNNNYFQYF